MKRVSAALLFLFPNVCLAGEYEEKIKAECEFTSDVAMHYAKYKFANRGYPVDSINYKDPVVYALLPLVNAIIEDGKFEILASDVAIFSQAAIDGEEIFDVMEKEGEKSKLVAFAAATLNLSCYYKKGLTLEQVKALNSNK